MVTPLEVLAVAQALLDNTGEASWRSAISRSYYAAFLYYRRLARQRGQLPEGFVPNVHVRVRAALEQYDPRAAEMLTTLREFRNRADYDEHDDIGRAAARHAVRLARRLIEL